MSILEETAVNKAGQIAVKCMQCHCLTKPSVRVFCSEVDPEQPFKFCWLIKVDLSCCICGLKLEASSRLETVYASQLHAGAVAELAEDALKNAYLCQCSAEARQYVDNLCVHIPMYRAMATEKTKKDEDPIEVSHELAKALLLARDMMECNGGLGVRTGEVISDALKLYFEHYPDSKWKY